MNTSRNPSANKMPIVHNQKLAKENKNNFNKNNYQIKNQLYSHNSNFDNFESTINKYSLKLFEKLNGSNTKNKISKPYDFQYNINSNINLFTKSINTNTKDIIKLSKNKDKKDNFSKSSNKFQKELNTENNFALINKDNLSSSHIFNNNHQNEIIMRKYSDNSKRNNNDANKLKNIKFSKDLYNCRNNNNFDLETKDNINNTNVKKIKVLNVQNNSKITLDLKSHNNLNNITTNKTKDKNEIVTLNNYKNTEKKENNTNNINNNAIEKEKKFSIIDIPAPITSSKEKDNTFINIHINENIEEISKNIKLTSKEKAYFILCKSQILPLSSQIIFSRSCNNIKKLISTKTILENHENFIKNKIKDYENKIISYNDKIISIFNPSKIAEITFNFITESKELEFKEDYDKLISNKKDYNFIYYKNYIKILYYIINENIEDNIKDEKLLSNLYSILNKKGYINIKDYLYFLFISSKNTKKENYFMKNIDNIDELINNEVPKLLCFNESSKMCKFIGFSLYLIKEIIDFGNIIKNTIKLKFETISFIEKLKENLDKFKTRFIK